MSKVMLFASSSSETSGSLRVPGFCGKGDVVWVEGHGQIH
jgi:hypothetical protein